jgi:hypothetical protein
MDCVKPGNDSFKERSDKAAGNIAFAAGAPIGQQRRRFALAR